MAASSLQTSSPHLTPPTVRLTPATPPSPVSATFLGPPITSSAPSTSIPAKTAVPRSMPIVTEMREKSIPTESETALISDPTQSVPHNSASAKAGPIQNLSRRLSGKGRQTSDRVQESTENEKVVPSMTPIPTAKPSIASTATSAAPSKPNNNANSQQQPMSTARPAQTSTQKAAQKKKRKRKGLAGLFVALGCLSAGDFEDDERVPSGGATQMTQRQNAGASKAMASNPSPDPSSKPVDPSLAVMAIQQASNTGTTGTTGTTATNTTTLVGGEADTGRGDVIPEEVKPEAVLLAPVEPVILPDDETAGVTSSAVQPPGSGSALLSTPLRPHSLRRDSDTAGVTPVAANERTETSGGYSNISDSEVLDESSGQVTEEHGEAYPMDEEEYEDEEDRLIAQGGMGIPLDENGQPAPLLPVMDRVHTGRKCLVLDLDETLLHSSFKMLPAADYIVPVEIESQTHNVYVMKRPGADHFLKEMGKIYEVVVFTASLSKYADPVLDMLDVHRVIRHRLFRESCYNHKGNYVKDLSQLGREMEACIIIDNSPASYIFHPNNAVPVSTWFNDPHDTELTDLCPFLSDLATVDDIRGVLDGSI